MFGIISPSNLRRLGILGMNRRNIGFIGAYDQKQKALFVKAFNSINHRGPDSSNIFESNKFLLGHKRLSIIDIVHY